MAKALNVKKIVVLLMVWGPIAAAWAQTSTIGKSTSRVGSQTVVRYNPTGNYLVTCAKGLGGNSFFVVKNGSTEVVFDIPIHYFPGELGASMGHVVNDLQIYGTTCWFCGSKWEKRGELIYPDGIGLPPYVEYFIYEVGFIGWFNIGQALAGSVQLNVNYVGTWDGDTVITTIDRLATYGSGVVAIGRMEGDATLLVELEQGTGLNLTYKVWNHSLAEEVFMDVVSTNGRIVTLSRFNNPIHTELYNYSFGLRHGMPSNFTSTGNTMYRYHTFYPFIDNRARFTGVTPIVLSSVNKGHEVTVSFPALYDTYYKGCFIGYHIVSAGAAPADVLISRNNDVYTEVVDAKFNKPLTFNAYMALLLKNTQGDYVLRYPYLNLSDIILYDTAWHIAEPIVESLAAYQNMSNNLDLFAAGHFSQTSNRIALVNEIYVHDRLSLEDGCLQGERTQYQSVSSDTPPQVHNIYPLVLMTSQSDVFRQENVTVQDHAFQNTCSE